MSQLNKSLNVYDCKLIQLRRLGDRSGFVTPVENIKDIPFEVNRVFYLYDIPGGESRGAHAHKECHQLIIAASGAFEVSLDDGQNNRNIQLNRPYLGLHIPPGIWASEVNFSSGSVCLVLASHLYSDDDYIRDYYHFIKWKLS